MEASVSGSPVLPRQDPRKAVRVIHFRDPRAPQEIQFELERELMTLLPPVWHDSRLEFRADAKINGIPHRFLLKFDAALPRINAYSLRIEACWADLSPAHQDHFRKTSSSWFDFWIRNFKPTAPPLPGENAPDRYQALAGAAMAAESHLTSVLALQQEILMALRQGATYATAHKEGGTTIKCVGNHFVRADYGESNERVEFKDAATFLAFLREFYDWETSRNTYPSKVCELDAWRLMLRLLRRPN